MRVLVLGASGLLGHTIFRVLSETTEWSVVGAVRNPRMRAVFPPALAERIVVCGDLEDPAQLSATVTTASPEVVVNCLSVPKSEVREDNLRKLLSNLSVLPQRISHTCALVGARLIHFSSDGVFSGERGGYSEDDLPDATDVYGLAKYLGEVSHPHTISIRTSMIGHELQTANGLLEWFLSQDRKCTCFRRAIFSGLPTVELAGITRDFVIPRSDLSGVYHIAARAISKFDLMQLVADVYGKTIELVPDDRVVIDRSLNADRFRVATGYEVPDWPELIRTMHADHIGRATFPA